MPTGTPVIRSASVDIGILGKVANARSLAELIAIAKSQPLMCVELQLFHAELLRQIERIISGEAPRRKIFRKSVRTLVSVLSRAASRATPSRVIGSVGTLHTSTIDSVGIVLCDAAIITGSRRMISVKEPNGEQELLRWNPSNVVLGERSYLTAPRKAKLDVFSSVGMNPLLCLIHELTKKIISRKDLISSVQKRYSDIPREVIEKVICQLVDKEVLLTEQDEGYYVYRQERKIFRENIHISAEGIDGLFVDDASSLDIDLYRDAHGMLPDTFDSVISDYLEHGFEYGVFDYNDSGITAIFAELLLEKYGAARVPITHLIHPTKGLPWDVIKSARNSVARQKNLDYQRAVYSLGVQSDNGWVDLKEVAGILPVTGRTYSNLDSVDVIASLHGDADHAVFSMADAISGIFAGSTTGRFDLLDNHVLENHYAVNIDWISNKVAFNSVRESEACFSRTINVNAFTSSDNELTISDLQVWSDGADIYVCDAAGDPVEFQPTSMAGVGAFPEWLMQIAIAGTAHTPDINWSWGEIENNVDYLPGVRYGSLILSRPAHRYTGSSDPKDFNNWAYMHNIPEWIRIGSSDKKILINRSADNYSELLYSELQRGDGWIYSTFTEELTPFSSNSEGEKIYSEISRSFVVEGSQSSRIQQRDTARKLPVVIRSSQTKEIIPTVTDYANLVLIPRDGFYGRVLTTLFGHNPLSSGMYFIRYPSSSGKSSIRLRFLRDSETTLALRAAIAAMTESGLFLDIVEEPHSFEFERYGGERIFSLFRRLAMLESLLVVEIASSFKDAVVPAESHLHFLDWWLDLFPGYREEVIAFSTDNQVFEAPTKKEASLIARVIGEENITSVIPEDLSLSMREIAQRILEFPLNPYELHSAAHLFCNRLGITADREKALWLALNKVERKKNYDRLRI